MGHVGLPEVMCFNQPRATLDVKTLLIINWHSPQSAVTFKNALCVQNRASGVAAENSGELRV